MNYQKEMLRRNKKEVEMALSRISQNIRSLRIAQGMTVDKLAAKSGFSKGFISQVENFRVSPSLKALNKIADALGIDIHVLFQDEAQTPEYTFGSLLDGEEVSRDNGGHFGIIYHALAYRQIGRNMDPFLIEYHPSTEDRDFMMHDTEEFYVLLEGELDFYIMDENNCTSMKAMDTLYMKADLPHKVRLANGCTYAKALVIYGNGSVANKDPGVK